MTPWHPVICIDECLSPMIAAVKGLKPDPGAPVRQGHATWRASESSAKQACSGCIVAVSIDPCMSYSYDRLALPGWGCGRAVELLTGFFQSAATACHGL